MRVSLFSQDILWLDVDANLEKIKSLAQKVKGQSDLIVLPEMFNTGYIMTPHLLDRRDEEKTRDILSMISQECSISILGTIPTYREGKYYNTTILAHQGVIEDVYDKIHLFSLAGEHQNYTAGLETKPFILNDLSLLPLICYDLRFPYAAFRHFQKHAIIYCANWPVARIDQWKSLLIARAIENQCYVIGVNRTGSDGNNYVYNAQSMVIDFSGNIMYSSSDVDEFFTIELDIKSLTEYRLKLPFLDDCIVL